MAIDPTFTERGPYEKGFAEVFDQQIAPKLEGLEQERLALIRKRQRRLMITIVVTAVAALVAVVLSVVTWGRFQGVHPLAGPIAFAVVLPLATTIGGYLWISHLPAVHVEALRGIVVAAACSFFGDLEYFRNPGDRFDHKRFTDLGVVPSGACPPPEDLFVGRYRDTDFKMVEAKVIQMGNGHSTLFDGLLFEIGVPMEFSGRVLIGRDKGRIGNALKGLFKGAFGKPERVYFDDAAFEERYAVYASDSGEAMRLVSPEFCKNMLALADAYSDKSLGAAFVDGVFLLAVPVPGDLFEPGSIKRSVYDCEDDIHEFLDQLTLAHRVIDYLYGDRPPVPGFEAGAKHAGIAGVERRHKRAVTWAAIGIGTFVLLVLGVSSFVSLQKKKVAEVQSTAQADRETLKASTDYGFAPYRRALAALEADEDVGAALGTPLSPGRLFVGNTQAAGPEGRVMVVFDIAGSRAHGTATARARKCDGAWWVKSLSLELADPDQPTLSVVTDIDITPPLAELRRQVAAFGDASLDATVAYRDAQRLIDNYSGGICDLVAARALFFEAARAAPGGASAYIGLGRLAYKAAYHSGDKYDPEGLKRAQEYFAAALDIDGTAFDAYFYRTYAHLYSKDIARARDDAERASALESGSARWDLLFAEIAIREKDYDQAETNAKSVVARSSGDTKLLSDAYGVLTRVYRARKQYDLVETMYLKTIELNPKSPWDLINYSRFLIWRDDYDKAIEFGEKALALRDFGMGHRVVADAYYAKGDELHWGQKKHEEARPYFERVIEHDAYHTNAHYGLGMSYYRSGHSEKNVADLNRAEVYLVRTLELDPGHAMADENLIELRKLLAWVEEEGLR